MSKREVLNVGIVCGEHSGDRLGAGLIEELRKHYYVNLYGVGGPKLEKLGLKSFFQYQILMHQKIPYYFLSQF